MVWGPRHRPVWVGVALLGCLGAGPATRPAAEVWPGVLYFTKVDQNPTVLVHIYRINLSDSRISLHVSAGGPAPEGGGRWTTTLLPVTKMAERDGLDLAVNGDYFESDTPANAGGGAGGLAALVKGGYRAGMRARPMGSAVTDGRQWSTGREARPALMVDKAGRVTVGEIKGAPAGVEQAVCGNYYLVREGVLQGHRGDERNARTAVGVNKERTVLTIVVVDGLVDGRASGISIPDLVRLMAQLGCSDAIDMDGGGSSTLVVRDRESGKVRVVNHPTDGRPRAVANALGVRVKRE